MTAPLGNSEFCFHRISVFPSTSSPDTLRFSETKFTVPLGTTNFPDKKFFGSILLVEQLDFWLLIILNSNFR